MISRGIAAAALSAVLATSHALAEDKENESLGELELGAVGDWGMPAGASAFGPSAAIEFNAIKDRLEIEAGLSPLFSHGQTEWSTDLIFKTPIYSFEDVEVTFGAGPEWLHNTGGGQTTDALAGELQLDFQFWRPDRKYGLFVEPSYDYSFANGHEQSLGVTIGLLIAFQ